MRQRQFMPQTSTATLTITACVHAYTRNPAQRTHGIRGIFNVSCAPYSGVFRSAPVRSAWPSQRDSLGLVRPYVTDTAGNCGADVTFLWRADHGSKYSQCSWSLPLQVSTEPFKATLALHKIEKQGAGYILWCCGQRRLLYPLYSVNINDG